MKKLLLSAALLSTFSLSAKELPYYDYQVTIKSDVGFELQSSGSLAPLDNYPGEVELTVDGVVKKIAYNPVSKHHSTNDKTTLSMLMYITEDNTFVLSAYTSVCGDFDYQSKVMPTDTSLQLNGSKGCALSLGLSVHEFKD